MSAKKAETLKAVKLSAPIDVVAIRGALAAGFQSKDSEGRQIGSAPYGIYAFYDYDDEPIYVGQTRDKGGISGRVGRHITNQRTDAVAMSVLDPFEVCDIELWPFFDLTIQEAAISEILNRAEYCIYLDLIERSRYKAILNEKPPREFPSIALPPPFKFRIIPDEIYKARLHPDVRIARRASTIAKLAQVISERSVGPGLRRTLLTQTIRLNDLAAQRLKGAPKKAASKEEAEEMKPGNED